MARLLTCADQAAVGDHTALTSLPHHFLEDLQCMSESVTTRLLLAWNVTAHVLN